MFALTGLTVHLDGDVNLWPGVPANLTVSLNLTNVGLLTVASPVAVPVAFFAYLSEDPLLNTSGLEVDTALGEILIDESEFRTAGDLLLWSCVPLMGQASQLTAGSRISKSADNLLLQP